MTDSTNELDQLLEGVSPKKRKCSVCSNKKVADLIAGYLALKAAGDDRALIPLTTFYRDSIQPLHGGPGERTVRDHVRLCLGLNIQTGRPLGDD